MLRPGDLAPAFHLQPVFGRPVDLDQLTARRPVVLVFLRAATATQSRIAVETLHELMPRLDAEGIPLIGFLRGGRESVYDFVPRHHVLFPVVWDETGEWYAAYGVQEDKMYLGTLRHAGAGVLRSAIAALGEGRGPIEDGNNVLPAELVIGPGRRVVYAHYADSILHQPNLEDLWEACQRS